MCKRGLVTAGLCFSASMLGWAQYTEAAPNKARGGTDRILTRSTQLAAAAANKVTICHKAGPVKFFELSVAGSAVPGHLRHGDCVVDDGNACTSDSCDPATGCVYSPITCDDGNACTTDSCDPAAGCQYADNIICGDGVVCTGEACDDGNTNACDGCSPVCTLEYCGDGVVCAPEECESDADCPEGSACSGCTCSTPDECFKGEVCDLPQTCTTEDGCNGACFHTAAGPTKCFFGEYSCGDFTTPCDADSDCSAGSACANSCCGATCVPLCNAPPPVNECFKEAPCAGPETCTTGAGCNGACFFTAAGTTKCFAGEFGCGTGTPCTSNSDCAPGSACSDTCCGLECTPLCGGTTATAGFVVTISSKAPTAAAAAAPVNVKPTGKSSSE